MARYVGDNVCFCRTPPQEFGQFGNYLRDKLEEYFPMTEFTHWRIDLQWSCVKGLETEVEEDGQNGSFWDQNCNAVMHL